MDASSPCRRVTSWIKAIAWAIVVFHDNALAAGRDIVEMVDLKLTTPLERLPIELQV
jgi:hypothetical protein